MPVELAALSHYKNRLPRLVAPSRRLIMADTPNDESLSGIGFRTSADGTRTPEPRLGSVRFSSKHSPAGYPQSLSLSVTAHRMDRARRRASDDQRYQSSPRRLVVAGFRRGPLSLRWFSFSGG